MKRLVTILLSALLMMNCVYSSFGRVFALEGAEQTVTADVASPREILRGTHTSIETYGAGYQVKVTIMIIRAREHHLSTVQHRLCQFLIKY